MVVDLVEVSIEVAIANATSIDIIAAMDAPVNCEDQFKNVKYASHFDQIKTQSESDDATRRSS
ncbi:hypothetical protein Goshw_026848, partial [Gossypium schwendimanii]|nr:hypothetical protein [Gossypium schwendimanii]